MRTFIGAKLSKNLHNLCLQTQKDFKELNLNVKWVENENIHLTLKFLGDTDPDTCEKIKEVFDSVADKNQAIKTSIKEIGVFPKIKQPRVLWVGLQDSQHLILNCFNKIELLLEPFGFQKEKRKFTPHVTLGRFRSFKNLDSFIQKMEGFKVQPVEGFVEKIVFFESQLTQKGAIYTPLQEINL